MSVELVVDTGPPEPGDLADPGVDLYAGLSTAERCRLRQVDQAAQLRAGLPVGWPPPTWIVIEGWTDLVAAVRAFYALPRKWQHLLGGLRFRLGWY